MRCRTILTGLLTCTLLLLLAAAAGAAPAQKVKVCHIPPGNPANFHTITISENALPAHLAHGDLPGPCAQYCDTLCSDGDPCTVDACDANEHCLVDHPPVNCDDGNLCTTDSCDPANGCVNAPLICDDNLNCTVDACDPLTGFCVAPPVDCPEGQTCDPATGECFASGPCEPNPCGNGGECADVDGEPVCSCAPGYTGDFCEFEIDECESSPCLRGDCIDEVNGYTCDCFPGWTGTNCEIDIDECASNPCVNAFDCIDEENGYFCVCLPGWTGTNCDEEEPLP